MLAKFAVTNFRGFKDRIELNLMNPRNYDFNTFAIKNNIIKNGIIYGQNGCGKSNLSLAIFDIVYHLTQKFKSPNYLENYAFTESKLVTFEYTFIFDKQKVEYIYSKNAQGFLQEEKLIVNNKNVFKKTQNSITIDTETFPMEENIKNDLSKSANGVSIVNFLITTYPLKKDNYLIKLQNFVNSMLWFRCLERREFIGLETNIYILEEYIIKNNFVEDFSAFLEKVSGQHFNFVQPNPNDKLLRVYIGDSQQVFNLISSTGTHSLTLLYFWIKHLEKASFVFIDEFDAFYHFKLSFDVCEILFKQNCQLFLSSHNTFLMTNDLLRPDCNFILKDNKIKALCDITDKELREGHNIEKLYRGGTFEL